MPNCVHGKFQRCQIVVVYQVVVIGSRLTDGCKRVVLANLLNSG